VRIVRILIVYMIILDPEYEFRDAFHDVHNG
jgi:hypothetical protein